MDAGQIAAISVAVGGVIAAITTLVVALTKMMEVIRSQGVKIDANAVKLAANTKTTDLTHQLVNSQKDRATVRLDALESALTAHGIALPVDPEIASAQKRIDVQQEEGM
jgi:FAD/FMN-containing dehydrogenase